MFVVIAMGVVALALGTALNKQFGLDLNVAISIGAVAYALLLAIHAGKRRKANRAAAASRRTPDFEAFESVHDRLSGEGQYMPPPMPGRADRSLSQLEMPPPVRSRAKVAQVSLPSLSEHGGQHRQSPSANLGPSLGGGPLPSGSLGVANHGSGRSAGPRPFQPASVTDLGGTVPSKGDTEPSGNLESDVERIQALVKKLANEVNAIDEEAERPQIYGRPPRLPSDVAADASVGALRQTAEGMKSAASPSGLHGATGGNGPPMRASAQISKNAPPPLSTAQAHIAAVADALVAGRVEVELEPILSLVDQRTSHYEVSVNVHGPAGERLVENSGFGGLQGTGLLPLFDSARLNRSVTIAQRLLERGKRGRVFSAYSAESLTNGSFLNDARSALQDRNNISAQLVIGFQQADIRAFTPAEWAALSELRQMHVVFAIDKLTHLDLDLKQLVTSGFVFARVEGSTFFNGLKFGGRPVGSSELVRYVTGSGMTLVVDQIDTEQQLQRLGQAGVQLGQGKVFGGRRAVKVSATKSNHAAA